MSAAMESLVVGPCKDCGGSMLNQSAYWHRADLRELGYLRHIGHGLCNTDYSRARRAGTLPNPAPKSSRPVRLPRVSIQPVYPVVCEECGELARVDNRRDAEWEQQRHIKAHRRGEVLAEAS